MISIEAFSELLQVLYSAPLQQEQWQRFLTLVSEYTRSSNGFFISTNDQLRLVILAEGGRTPSEALVSTYNQEYAHSDPFREAAIRYARNHHPIGVFAEDELLPGNALLQTPIYRDLLAQRDLRYAAIIILGLSVRHLDAISLWRTPAEGPIDTSSRRLLELLVPHIQNAVEVNRRFKVSEQNLANAEAMANASPTATFVLSGNGDIRHCNTAAESMIRAGDGLKLKNGQLIAGDSAANQALQKMILRAAAACFTLSGDSPSRALSLRRAAGKRPLQLIAMPLPRGHRQHADDEVLLLVTDPEISGHFPDELLRALYGFTFAEVEVANGLLMGYSAQEIACLRRVSTGTVRQQIKNMLGKTDTSRQSDMVRLFMTLPRAAAQVG